MLLNTFKNTVILEKKNVFLNWFYLTKFRRGRSFSENPKNLSSLFKLNCLFSQNDSISKGKELEYLLLFDI